MRSCLQFYNLFYGPQTQMGPVSIHQWFQAKKCSYTHFQEIIPVYFNQLPGGTALKIFDHSAQLILGHLTKYNYGEKNLEHYHSLVPPTYEIEHLKIPTYLIYSIGDWATTKKVIFILKHNLDF